MWGAEPSKYTKNFYTNKQQILNRTLYKNVTSNVFTFFLLSVRQTECIDYMDYVRISGLHGMLLQMVRWCDYGVFLNLVLPQNKIFSAAPD